MDKLQAPWCQETPRKTPDLPPDPSEQQPAYEAHIQQVGSLTQAVEAEKRNSLGVESSEKAHCTRAGLLGCKGGEEASLKKGSEVGMESQRRILPGWARDLGREQ